MHAPRLILRLLLLSLLCLCSGVQAIEEKPFAKIILTDLTQSINLVKSGYLIHDPAQRWSMQALQDQPASWRELLQAPNSKITAQGQQYWLIIEIENSTAQENWYLNFSHSRTDDIEVLVRDNSGIAVDQYLRSGMAHKPTDKPYVGPGHVFPIKLAANTTQLLLIKANSSLFEGNLYAHLNTESYHREHFGHYQTLAVLYIGMMLALALYNLFIFFGTRDRIYLWYMLSGLCIGLTWASYFGVLWQLTGYSDPARHLAAVTQLGSAFFALLFTRDFLNIAHDHPILNRIYFAAIAVIGLAIAAFPFIHASTLYLLYWLSILPLSLLMLSSSIWRMIEGYRAARFIIIGHSLIAAGLFVTGMSYLRLIPYDAPQPLAFACAAALEMLFFGVAMADRIKQLHHAKLNAEQATEIKSTFLAIMSHEIRTPLAGLMSIVRILGNTPLNASQQKLVNTINYSGDTLLSLLNDTLDYSRLEAKKHDLTIRQFDLRLLADSLVLLMEGRASEKGLILSAQVDPLLANILCGDINRIRQILINLLANAIKFTDRGIVKLHIEKNHACEHGLLFTVIDSGIGMNDEVKKQIFMPFGQGSDIQRRFGGAGLGLNISRSLARAMGGDITVESSEGHGSTFCFSAALPPGQLSAGQLSTGSLLDAPAQRPGAETPIRALHLLVVDDTEINRIAAKGILEQEGHRVTLASDGREALHRLQEASFDCILMDVYMPGMDGATAIRHIRALPDPTKNSITIIALSAWLQETGERELLACGANAACMKPIDINALNTIFNRIKPHLVKPHQSPSETVRPKSSHVTPLQAETEISD
jgi:signal transduction histidine kinase/CheY-like chemotaxis protein